jgi:Fe-S oxidoreductase
MYPVWGIEIGRPVFHLAQYLAGRLTAAPGTLPGRATVVYHDPGSLARGLDVVEAPRTLLRAIDGVALVEAIPGGRRASSDGPLAGYPRPDIASAIAARRVQELLATDADCIATASPYSLRNLGAVGHGVPVMDVLSIVASACGAIEPPPEWAAFLEGRARRVETGRALAEPVVGDSLGTTEAL